MTDIETRLIFEKAQIEDLDRIERRLLGILEEIKKIKREKIDKIIDANEILDAQSVLIKYEYLRNRILSSEERNKLEEAMSKINENRRKLADAGLRSFGLDKLSYYDITPQKITLDGIYYVTNLEE